MTIGKVGAADALKERVATVANRMNLCMVGSGVVRLVASAMK
jgi:hypothetical protein